jgi:RNA polymerase sigma-70 factor (ECF subfamily)
MAGPPKRFTTTRWSLVKEAGHPDAPAGAAALAELCEAYWFPIYAYIRRTGKSGEDARDLTQAFLARMIEKNDVSDADPARGRFRTFLLASVRHFLANQHDAATARKRGGGARHLPIEIEDGERRYAYEPVDHQTPEHVFERRWALAALEAAMARLGQRYADGDRRPIFDALRPCLAGADPPSYAALATRLATTEAALRIAMHRLRRAFRDALRDVIEETVARPEDVDDELQYLLAVVSR